MSGHSKWANIKNKKAVQDKKRSNVFTKLTKDITIAARGGANPEMNFKLRMMIEKARHASLPKENIERAIKRGSGGTDGDILEQIVYEGYAPGGVAVVIEATTDNKNRTAGNIRATFSKCGGSMGSANSVMWMFDHLGVIRVNKPDNQSIDDFMLTLIDQGAKDVVLSDGDIIVLTEFGDFQKVLEFLESQKISIIDSSLEYLPNTHVQTSEEDVKEKVNHLVDTLLDDDDVNEVYINLA